MNNYHFFVDIPTGSDYSWNKYNGTFKAKCDVSAYNKLREFFLDEGNAEINNFTVLDLDNLNTANYFIKIIPSDIVCYTDAY